MNDHFNDVINALHQYENDMCSYKKTLKDYIMSCMHNAIVNYESLVRKSLRTKTEFPKLKDYLFNTINKLLDQ